LTTSANQYDIIIVGGGMVGASLGCALGNKSLKIAIIEAHANVTETPPSYDDRAIALSYGSSQIFRAMGLWEQIGQHVTPITNIHVSDQGHPGATRINSRDEKVDALGYVITASALGKILYQRLQNFDNVDFLRPARLTKLELTDDSAEATLDLEGRAKTLHARLIVAADGGNSSVRSILGITAKAYDYKQTAVTTNLSTSEPHNNVAYERFTGSGPLALLPMQAPMNAPTQPNTDIEKPARQGANHRCSLVWTQHKHKTDAVMALDDTAFLQQLQYQFGTRLGQFTQVGKRVSYPLHLIKANAQVQQRLVLIGNAAHMLHPIAGQGFNLGMRDVATLAQIIVECDNNQSDIGSIDTLNAYQAWRKQDQRRIIGFTDQLVRVFSNHFTPLAFARNIGLIATDIFPPLKHQLAKHSMGLAGKLPRLARGLPL